MKEKKRNEELDILKGLSIIAVVLGHTKFSGTNFIYLFHMAVFFMASGYFYSMQYSENIKDTGKFLIRRVKGLWVPFVVWNTVFTLLTNVFIKLNIYTSDVSIGNYINRDFVSIHKAMSITEMVKNIIKGFFMAGHTEMGGAFWFLRVLFYISAAYVCADFVLRKIFKKEKYVVISQGIVAALFLAVGYVMSLKNIDTAALDLMFSCYCLYYIGFLLKYLQVKTENVLYLLIMFVLGTVILCIMGRFGSISLGNNDYVNPAFLLVTSVCGWFMLYGLAGLIKKVKGLKNVLILTGQNSLYIVIFHFLAFKVASLIIAKVYSYPLLVVAAFPVITNTGAWWVLYLFVGVFIPIALGMLWKKIKQMVRKNDGN